MEKEELAPHVKDITRALGDKVSEEEIRGELENYLNVYRVSLGAAKRSIVKKHGGDPASLGIGVSKKLGELESNESSVDLLCRIVSINSREIEVAGNKKNIFYGILGDETATLPFTAWEPMGLEIEKGDVIRVQNAYTREWKEKPQVNFGTRTTVTKEERDVLPEFEPTISVSEYKVKDLKEGLGNVMVTARILSIEERIVDVSGEKKTVFSGVLGDKTGKAQFTAWSDFGLKENDVIKIVGGYIKSWRGIPQLSFDERAQIEKLDLDFPTSIEIDKSAIVPVEELEERGGAVDINVNGIVIDIRNGSGLIYRCSECKRVVQKGTCRIHGEVEGIPDLRTKAIIDDGTGALTAVFNREITEQLLNKKMEDCIKEEKEERGHEATREEITRLLVAQPIETRGNVTSDDYGLMLIAREASIVKIDVQGEAKTILEELRQ